MVVCEINGVFVFSFESFDYYELIFLDLILKV